MNKILLITPPFVQINTPYPATAYLKGYLNSQGIDAEQYDLSVELINEIFSSSFLGEIFDAAIAQNDVNLHRIYALRNRYVDTIDQVMRFLRGEDPSIANVICTPDFLPQASRFEHIVDLSESYGELGSNDCARYLSTLYLQDISDFIRANVSSHFEITRYAEKIAVSIPDFSVIEDELALPLNIIEKKMVSMLHERIEREQPDVVGFTIPFPGNLLAALRASQYIHQNFPHIKIVAGGGYPTTELRNMMQKGIFNYFNYIIIDDGELSLKQIMNDQPPVNTYTVDGYTPQENSCISHLERGCPDFSGLPHGRYISLCETSSPMQRLWNDGRWNKMTIAHGCYWGKCSFCDTSLDYIRRYDAVNASTFVDWMDNVAQCTGSHAFHFTDEAAPPKLLKNISLELLRRKRKYSWWTNIRFEKEFTTDVCALMAAAGCIAVSGGLEAAADRLLELINKGVSIEQATITTRNFFYAGIMVHAYLMYGLPTQSLQEIVDSLEIVRQMFKAQLLDSAYWHRYAMTMHSPMGCEPEKWSVKRKNKNLNSFANNEIYFSENRTYNINIAGEGLRAALSDYMAKASLDRPVHKWFEGKAPLTSIEPSEITDHLIKPDNSRLFDESKRLVWLGTEVEASTEGLTIHTSSEVETVKLTSSDRDFIIEITRLISDLNVETTLGQVKDIYAKYSEESFAALYHSKKWDRLRNCGLLQI